MHKPSFDVIFGQVHEYPVIKVPKEEIVDTNGAGDSYVGGFLAAYAKGKSLAECVNAACMVFFRSILSVTLL